MTANAHMAVAKRASRLRKASRLRLALAATAFLTAPALAAEHTLLIDGSGASYVIGGETAPPLPPRRSGGVTSGAVTLDLSVLDGLEQVRPEARQGPLRLNRPNRLIADAQRIRTEGAVTVFPDAIPRRPAWLKPPKQVAQKPIKLRPPRRSGRQLAQANYVAIPHPPPLPPVRSQATAPSTLASAAPKAPTLPPIRARQTDQRQLDLRPAVNAVAGLTTGPTAPPVAARADANLLGALPVTPASRRRTPMPDYVAQGPYVGRYMTEDGRIDVSPMRPGPAQIAAAPALMDPLPTPRPPAGASATAASSSAHVETETVIATASQPGFQPVEVTDDLRKKFPIIFDRDQPPEMARPGWSSPTPAAADRAARRNDELPTLASLAPKADPTATAAGAERAEPTDVALGAALQAGVTQPGDAVLAPPPPPARAIQAARAEAVAALPEPPKEDPKAPPRKPLAIPHTLARVTPPGQDGAAEALTVLTPPRANEAAAAPEFAPAPAGVLAEMDRLDQVASAPATQPDPAPEPAPRREPQQLLLALGTPPEPATPAKPRARGPLETEIAFAAASRALPDDAQPALSEIVAKLKADPALRVRLAGAASAGEAKRARDLALARALAVQRYLVSQGVLSEAIRVEPVSGAAGRDLVAVRLFEPA